MATLTMRARRFLKNTRIKLTVNGLQENMNKENTRRVVPVETTTSNALVSCDGFGYDWSDQAEECPTNFALMAYSSTSSNSEVSTDSNYSSSCLENVKILKEQNEQLLKDLRTSKLNAIAYKTGLESIEARLLVYKKNDFVYEEDIKVLKREIHLKEVAITELRRKLELAQKQKDEIQLTVENFKNSSKNLSKLIDCQIVDKCKIGLGYNDVPPTYTGNFMPRKPNFSFSGLEEFTSEPIVIKPVAENCEAKASEAKPKAVRKNNGAPIIEDWVSDNEEDDVPLAKIENKTFKPSFVKIDFVKAKQTNKTNRKTAKQKTCGEFQEGFTSYDFSGWRSTLPMVISDSRVENTESDLVKTRIERSYELKNRKELNILKIESVWTGIGVNAGNSKLMLLDINLLLLLKVNAARHNLLLLKVNAARHNLLLLLKVNAARHTLTNAVESTNCLPNATIFEELTRMGYEKLSQKLTFYKAFFSPQWKFLIHTILQCLSAKTTAWNKFSSTLAPAIISQQEQGECLEMPTDPYHTPTIIQPSTSHPLMKQRSRRPKRKDTQATLNEPSSLGTSSGSGPRRQDTIGDTITQTGFENVSKTSNDSLLAEVNTPRRDYMFEIESQETKEERRVMTHRLKRLYKVGRSARVISYDEASLGDQDDASKQGRITDIDADTGINIVSIHFDDDTDMFGVHDLVGDEVVVETEVASKDVNLSIDEVTLAQALAALKSAKPKANKVMLQEPD
ncbi:hypothetical protein Tco_0839428 [Tanacetum coccineum]|uniref:Uncharacterized protein n=1 Tax=Tanacetum coccineum TaxID=301880 RepID=A0ABQ5AV93_9ASTR